MCYCEQRGGGRHGRGQGGKVVIMETLMAVVVVDVVTKDYKLQRTFRGLSWRFDFPTHN